MGVHEEAPALTAELVWDRNTTATALSGVSPLKAGENTPWSPVVLLATAASMSLLHTFLALAREQGIPVLGYVAQQRPRLHPGTEDVADITISASISVGSDQAAAVARELWTVATQRAPVLQTLKCPVYFESSIVVLTECAVNGNDG
jgi:hypothetical protein